MGIFDKMFKKESVGFSFDSELQAWMVFVYVAVSSDGDFSDHEINTVARVFKSISFFKGQDPGSGFGKVSEGISAGNDLSGLMELAIPLIPVNHRNTLFAVLCELVMSDGNTEKSEINNLEQFAKALEISDSDVEKITYAMLCRYKFNFA